MCLGSVQWRLEKGLIPLVNTWGKYFFSCRLCFEEVSIWKGFFCLENFVAENLYQKSKVCPQNTCLNLGKLLNVYNKLPDVWLVKTILYHLWTTKNRGEFVCRGWKSLLIVLVLIFLVNSTPVLSIAASINQLSDIADKYYCCMWKFGIKWIS